MTIAIVNVIIVVRCVMADVKDDKPPTKSYERSFRYVHVVCCIAVLYCVVLCCVLCCVVFCCVLLCVVYVYNVCVVCVYVYNVCMYIMYICMYIMCVYNIVFCVSHLLV